MTNLYPGMCECGHWVAKGGGQAIVPAIRGARWRIGCVDCMTPDEKNYFERKIAEKAAAERQHAEGLNEASPLQD